MFTLSSSDVHHSQQSDPTVNIPIRFIPRDEKLQREISPKERTPPIIHEPTHVASCDDDGHIFVYDSNPNNHQEQTSNLNIHNFNKFYYFL